MFFLGAKIICFNDLNNDSKLLIRYLGISEEKIKLGLSNLFQK